MTGVDWVVTIIGSIVVIYLAMSLIARKWKDHQYSKLDPKYYLRAVHRDGPYFTEIWMIKESEYKKYDYGKSTVDQDQLPFLKVEMYRDNKNEKIEKTITLYQSTFPDIEQREFILSIQNHLGNELDSTNYYRYLKDLLNLKIEKNKSDNIIKGANW